MLAEIPIISPIFQALLNSIGWVLAWLYDLIPNYGVAIIITTILMRTILFPLGVKQIKSMQSMQALQPKIKDIQKKYKNNKQKAQEETMKLYREAGVNPLGGCLPVLAQFPLLITMFYVIRPVNYVGLDAEGQQTDQAQQIVAYEIDGNHFPVDSELFTATITHQGTDFLGLNLQCSASQAGSLENSRIKVRGTDIQVEEGRDLFTPDGQEIDATSRPVLPCGVDGLTSKIGYLLLLGVMIATSFFQTLQTQRASPSGAASNQQQMLLRIMPVFFGFISWSLPSGLPLYWTVTNLFMIGQQTLLLRAGHIGPEALDRRMAEQKAKLAAQGDKPQKKGRLATMMERAEEQQKQRQNQKSPPKKSSSKGAPPKGTQRKGSAQTQRKKKPGSGSGGSRG